MTNSTAEKAFAVVEAIGTLDALLWELYYEEFLTLCENESEILNKKMTVI